MLHISIAESFTLRLYYTKKVTFAIDKSTTKIECRDPSFQKSPIKPYENLFSHPFFFVVDFSI